MCHVCVCMSMCVYVCVCHRHGVCACARVPIRNLFYIKNESLRLLILPKFWMTCTFSTLVLQVSAPHYSRSSWNILIRNYQMTVLSQFTLVMCFYPVFTVREYYSSIQGSQSQIQWPIVVGKESLIFYFSPFEYFQSRDLNSNSKSSIVNDFKLFI